MSCSFFCYSIISYILVDVGYWYRLFMKMINLNWNWTHDFTDQITNHCNDLHLGTKLVKKSNLSREENQDRRPPNRFQRIKVSLKFLSTEPNGIPEVFFLQCQPKIVHLFTTTLHVPFEETTHLANTYLVNLDGWHWHAIRLTWTLLQVVNVFMHVLHLLRPIPEWPDLAKIRQLGKIVNIFGNILKVHSVISKILNLILEIFLLLGKLSVL